ncbi:MAG: hypothetical protein H0T47_22940 [Planctomycetaceae bacterium]|nr:hypothetical protein [Planctomycetaceae bacterium]
MTGRSAGSRQPVMPGSLPVTDAAERAPSRVRLDAVAGGWVVRSADPAVTLRVNGRLVRERAVRDGDIIGCGRSLFRIDLTVASPAESAPRRTITLQDVPRFASRQKGLSTVVTAPGKWGNVFARWYGADVLHLQGPADPHPDQLIARLGQRVRCHALVTSEEPLRRHERSTDLSSDARLVPLIDPDQADAAFIHRLWVTGAFIGVLSPLEPDVLVTALQPLSSLLAYPSAVRPLLCRPEAALVERLRAADAGLLFGGPSGWELFCCPEMLPLWRRLGLPEKDAESGWDYEVADCDDGFVRIGGPVSSPPPSQVAEALATRDSLHLLLDADVAADIIDVVPSSEIPGGSRGTRRLIGPGAGAVRYDLIERYWGRGAVLGLLSSREEREIVRLATRLPARADADVEPFGETDRDRLGGFDAVLYDPADATWAVFADPRPKPVWQRYGLPAPVLETPR